MARLLFFGTCSAKAPRNKHFFLAMQESFSVPTFLEEMGIFQCLVYVSGPTIQSLAGKP